MEQWPWGKLRRRLWLASLQRAHVPAELFAESSRRLARMLRLLLLVLALSLLPRPRLLLLRLLLLRMLLLVLALSLLP